MAKIATAAPLLRRYVPTFAAASGLVRDNEFGIELCNGARLSSPRRDHRRGRAGQMSILTSLLDVQRDKQIYTAAPPVISRWTAALVLVNGRAWELLGNIQGAAHLSRLQSRVNSWWEVYSFSRNPAEGALAPAMDIDGTWSCSGNDRIKAIFFATCRWRTSRYECEFVDESTAWITGRNQAQPGTPALRVSLPPAHNTPRQAACQRLTTPRTPSGLSNRARVLSIGVDIGRTRNTTEIFALGETTTRSYPLRMMLTLDNVEFDDQLGAVSRAGHLCR